MSKRSRGQAALDKYKQESSKRRDDVTFKQEENLPTTKFSSDIIVSSNSSEIEEKLNTIYSIFRNLDLIIHSFKMKKIPAQWLEVVESFNKVSTEISISLIDLAIILHICPSLYHLSWKIIHTNNHSQPSLDLVISIPISNETKLDNKHNVTIQTRLTIFRECIKDQVQLLSMVSWKDFLSSIQKQNQIPSKPSKEAIRKSLNNSNNKNDSFRRNVKEVVASLEKKNSFDSNGEANGLRSLEELALMASKRGEVSKLQEVQQRQQKSVNEQLMIFQQLPSLANVVRTHFHLQNRSSMTLSDCLAKITKDLKTNSKESKDTLLLLTRVVPEFITILPSDRACHLETVTVNRQTNFKEIILKLNQVIDLEVSKRGK